MIVSVPELNETIRFPDEMSEIDIRGAIETLISKQKESERAIGEEALRDIEPLPEADVSPYAVQEAGKQVLGTAETAMSLSSQMMLWPFSKAYGLMALPFGAEAAKMAESEIMSKGYVPYTQEGRGAVDLVGRGIQAYLTPTEMATEEVEKLSPELAWLTQLGGELGQFAMLGLGVEGGKVVKAELKARGEIKKARKDGIKIRNLIKERRANIDSGILDSEIFIRKYNQQHTPRELEAVPYIIQDIKDLKVLESIGKEDLIPIIENPSPELLKSTGEIQKYYEEAHEFLKEHWDEPGFVENYATQIWDIPKEKKGDVVNYFTKKNPFLKKRKIPSLEEGIEMGLTPKTTNITELLRVYDQYKVKTAYNMKFAEQLKEAVGEDGNPLMMRTDKAPGDWIEISHPALSRAMMVGKTKKMVPKTDTFRTISNVVEKIKTITRTIPEGGVVTGDVNGRIKALEKIMEESLEARGMTPGESSAYLGRLKSAYAGAEISEGRPIEHVSEEVRSTITSDVFSEIESKFPVDVPILQKVPVKVHPDIAKEVKILFEKPFSHEWITAYETVNAFTKKSMLTLSFFHHFALTESAFATGIGGKAAKMWMPWNIFEGIRTGNFEIFKNQPLARDAIESGGVTFGALEEVHRGKIQKTLEGIERATKDKPVIGRAAKAVRTANQLWDTALWDYYHNSLKLYAYEANVEAGLKGAKRTLGRDLTPNEIKDIKFEMGQFVNDSFGGQNWELSEMFASPKMRQILHWGFLAPDWTISTLRQATAPVRGKHLLTTEKIAKTVMSKRGALFWAKAAMYFNIIAQSANYYNTKKYKGEGRFTWENAPGHELNIYAGQNEDGTERYIRLGKQFREVMEWGIDPIKKLGSKASPNLREGIRQFAKHDPGSGYPTPWATKDFWDVEALKERGLSVLEMPIPFSLRPWIEDRPNMFMFSLPASKGMTNYKTVSLFKEAIKKEDKDKVEHIYFSALENNLDAQSLFKSAKASVKADMTFDDKKMAKEIWKELKFLMESDPKAAQDALQTYRERGIITENINKQMNRLLEKELSIKKQRELFGIEEKR